MIVQMLVLALSPIYSYVVICKDHARGEMTLPLALKELHRCRGSLLTRTPEARRELAHYLQGGTL